MYTKILDAVQLEASGAPTLGATFTLPSGVPRVGLAIAYLADESATGGKPGYRLYWLIPTGTTSIEVLATVRDETPEITEGSGVAVLREYDADVVCEDLVNSDASVIRYREFVPAVGATGGRLEPFETGDEAHPGVITAYVNGGAS